MKCYNCSHSEAQSRLLINYMGQVSEVYICAACLEDLKQYALSMLGEVKQVASHPRVWPNVDLRAAQVGGSTPFTADVGEKIRLGRELEELREKLRVAVKIEDYESAAALRDEIYRMEREVRTNAT
ncbi:MAG: UvrB/UvrC motif-containing protein [Oscillospiraceae bacterium]|nr:UvrB/UvrC motif-containing protein [Oscillospiraceae bacterium]